MQSTTSARKELGRAGLPPFFLEGESVLLAVGATLAERGLGSSIVGKGGAAAPKASTSSSFTNCISVGGLPGSGTDSTGGLARVGDWSLNASEDSL